MRIESEKFFSIQVLRGIAASAVLLAHISAQWVDASTPKRIFTFGANGVDLFFVISGFIMVHASTDLFAKPRASIYFFSRRLVRIVPLYWACTTLWLAYLVYLHHGIKVDNMSISQIVGSYMFVPIPRPSGDTAPVLGVGWTLDMEMIFYLVFAVAITLPRRYAVALASLIMMALMYGAIHDASHTLIFYSNYRIAQFVVGMAFGLIYCEGIRLSILGSSFLFGLGALIIAIYFSGLLGGYPNWTFDIAIGLMVVSFALCKTSAKKSLIEKTALLYGDTSFALYLTHSITLSMLANYFTEIFKANAHPILFFFLQVMLCIAIAVLVHLYIEKPITRFLNRAAKAALKIPQPVEIRPTILVTN